MPFQAKQGNSKRRRILFRVMVESRRGSRGDIPNHWGDKPVKRQRGLTLIGIAVLLGAWISIAWIVPAQAGSQDEITMQVKLECLNFEGDCTKFRILTPPAAQAAPWLTIGGCNPDEALAGKEIEDGIVVIRPGELVLVKIAYVNDTDKPMKFRSLPHFIEPQNLQKLAVFNCFCLGETYTVPPHTGWFRIVRLGAAFDMPIGSRFVATHILTSNALVE